MARPKKEQQQATVREILRRHDVDPLDRLIREGITEIKLSATQVTMPCVQSLLSNYELVPGEGDGWILRPNLARRIEIWKATCDFVHPRLRSTEVKLEEDRSITWVLKTYENGKEVLKGTGVDKYIANRANRASEPLELRNGEPERELHPGEHESIS